MLILKHTIFFVIVSDKAVIMLILNVNHVYYITWINLNFTQSHSDFFITVTFFTVEFAISDSDISCLIPVSESFVTDVTTEAIYVVEEPQGFDDHSRPSSKFTSAVTTSELPTDREKSLWFLSRFWFLLKYFY